ncbi:uncharacterized protein LOC144623807 [Crassostrea virginica]
MLRASRASKSRSPYAGNRTAKATSRPKKQRVTTATQPHAEPENAILDLHQPQTPYEYLQPPRAASVPESTPIQLVENCSTENQQLMQSQQDSIWIIGSSIIHWAHVYAKNLNQDHLGRESSTILWHGIRGMVWEQLYPTIQFLLAHNATPNIIIIHCGGNNIGQSHNTLRGLQKFYKSTLVNIANLLPTTSIIWSHILPRNNWVNCLANMEGNKCRRRINSACATFVTKHFKGRGASISYPDIRVEHKKLFRKDGVHLSDLGNSIFVNTLRNALDHFISCNFVSQTFP